MATQDELKHVATEEAVEFVPEDEYIGIDTGSTINIFIEALGRSSKQVKEAVSASVESSELLTKYDIPEVSLPDVSGLAVYVGGADEASRMLQMTKDGGGAYLSKKIIASASDKFVCIADKSRYVSRLGKFPLPAEVIPYARSLVSRRLMAVGGEPELRVGFTTFDSNQIVGVHGPHINRPVSAEGEINRVASVVEDSIFGHNAADVLMLGTEQGAKVILPGQN